MLALFGVAAAWVVAAVIPWVMPELWPEVVGIVLSVLPAVALVLLVVALLPGAERSLALAEVETRLADARAQVAALQDQLTGIDATLAHSAESTAGLAAAAGGRMPGLAEAATALEAAAARVSGAGATTQGIVDGFGRALPALEATIATVDATLRHVSSDAAVQLRAVEQMLGQVQARNAAAAADADAAIGEMTALLTRIEEVSARNTQTLSKRAYALDAAVDGVLERTTAAVDGIRERVTEQLVVMQGAVEGNGKQLALYGDDSARLFNQRIELLLRTSESLREQFRGHEDESAQLQAVMAGHVADVEARLAALGAEGGAVFDTLTVRLGGIEDGVLGLAGPLADAQASVAGLETASGQLGTLVGGLQSDLGARLATTQAAMAALEDEAGRLFAAVATLDATVREGSARVGEASAGVAAEREAVTAMAGELAGHFAAAQAVLAAVSADGAAAAEAMAAGLGAEVARIADAGGAAANEVRVRLAQVVDDAVAAIDTTVAERAEAAFGGPVQRQVAAMEAVTARAAAAAQGASERMAARMLALVDTVAAVEARVGEAETNLQVRARDTLAARSVRVIEALQAAAVDVAGLLSVTVSEADWAAYLRGDTGVVARAVAPQLNRETARQMARLWAQDPEFRREAARYCELFEALVQRLLGDRDGETLAATMLTSDIGKIYVAIADAAERLVPQRAGP